ncbi:phosphatidylglycerol lysyltransferase domain-containing protein [Streptomyces boncukensis]|uniref:DUF2156 domain-containing protein n=1 Tax=Streptomyces boncukensis TaxID=2711219 RepID=A0A6G4X5M3_9ACTN|nr:phosphatidylglycerol lysyltransferase domain-containing protein [Streptomyces boncukensis]NGO72170.1 DUF2156 domain-containing protein [Streptomyces boncukensis]
MPELPAGAGPSAPLPMAHAAVAAAVRQLVADFGAADSLGYFATRRDRLVCFSPGRDAAVSFTRRCGVFLAAADPLGRPGSWAAAAGAWRDAAARARAVPAAFGAGRRGAAAYAAGAGLRRTHIGDEAVLPLEDFTLLGRRMRPVRQAVHRCTRAGLRARIRWVGDLSAEERRHVAVLAERWRPYPRERGFAMALGRFGGAEDRRCLLAEALDRHGGPVALLAFVPWGADGLSLDLMRRSPHGPNGVHEFLVSALADRAAALGVRRLSLTFSPLRPVMDGTRQGAGARLLRTALTGVSPWWQFEGLYRAGARYHPCWEPRFLCSPGRLRLPRAGLAILVAEDQLVPRRPRPPAGAGRP